jgi:hypothetical protein
LSDIKSKLLSRPIEADTLILEQAFIQFEECIGLFEKWTWDGVSASSIVLILSDVPRMKEMEFIASLFKQMQLPLDKDLTTSVSGDYYFLNFNFSVN